MLWHADLLGSGFDAIAVRILNTKYFSSCNMSPGSLHTPVPQARQSARLHQTWRDRLGEVERKLADALAERDQALAYVAEVSQQLSLCSAQLVKSNAKCSELQSLCNASQQEIISHLEVIFVHQAEVQRLGSLLASARHELQCAKFHFQNDADELRRPISELRTQLDTGRADLDASKRHARAVQLSLPRQNVSIERFLHGARSNARQVSGYIFHHPREVFNALGLSKNEDGTPINKVQTPRHCNEARILSLYLNLTCCTELPNSHCIPGLLPVQVSPAFGSHEEGPRSKTLPAVVGGCVVVHHGCSSGVAL